jgi:hypothetical protein
MRSVATLGVFTSAALVVLWFPLLGMALICVCLLVYSRPDPLERTSRVSPGDE